MREESLDRSQKKYTTARIEIQVASVLMHAWSEVEHDLVYKPLQGTLSDEELAILDELNGLVLAGEIALERLQNAGNERIRNKNAEFGSQYELASYLYNYLSNNFRPEDIELRMGNIELLFKLSSRLKINSVKELEPVLKSVKFEKDRRNISQQIIDQMITGSEKRSSLLTRAAAGQDGISEDERHAVELFFSQWVPLEQLLNRVFHPKPPQGAGSLQYQHPEAAESAGQGVHQPDCVPAQDPQCADSRYRNSGSRLYQPSGRRKPTSLIPQACRNQLSPPG